MNSKQPPRSPCYCCREPSFNQDSLQRFLGERTDWALVRRIGRPAVEKFLARVLESPSFEMSAVVDANDPWLDEFIELLPPGPERLLLYGDMAGLVEFCASLTAKSNIRVCFALGPSSCTEELLGGHRSHWISLCYAGSRAGFLDRNSENDEPSERLAVPGDLFISKGDRYHGECMGYDCDSVPTGPDGERQRLVMRVMAES